MHTYLDAAITWLGPIMSGNVAGLLLLMCWEEYRPATPRDSLRDGIARIIVSTVGATYVASVMPGQDDSREIVAAFVLVILGKPGLDRLIRLVTKSMEDSDDSRR